MGRTTKLTSDISGQELSSTEDSYQVSFSRTLEPGKSFSKCDRSTDGNYFIISHPEFMDMMGKQNYKPAWVKIVKKGDKWVPEG